MQGADEVKLFDTENFARLVTMVDGRIGGERLAKIKLWTSWVKPLPHERRNQYAFVPLLRRKQASELKRFSISL